MPHMPDGITGDTPLAIIQRITADIDRLAAAVTHDRDIPAVERLVDGGGRRRLRARLGTLSLAAREIERYWTECLAELQRVEDEADSYHSALAEGLEMASA